MPRRLSRHQGACLEGAYRDVVLDGRGPRAVERLVGHERPPVAVVRDVPHLPKMGMGINLPVACKMGINLLIACTMVINLPGLG